MFVNIVHFPPIAPEDDDAFRDWFARSSERYAAFPGFIGRRLLVPREGGNYAAIVEHESQESFMAMHLSEARDELHKEVVPLFGDGRPEPVFYDVVMG